MWKDASLYQKGDIWFRQSLSTMFNVADVYVRIECTDKYNIC